MYGVLAAPVILMKWLVQWKVAMASLQPAMRLVPSWPVTGRWYLASAGQERVAWLPAGGTAGGRRTRGGPETNAKRAGEERFGRIPSPRATPGPAARRAIARHSARKFHNFQFRSFSLFLRAGESVSGRAASLTGSRLRKRPFPHLEPGPFLSAALHANQLRVALKSFHYLVVFILGKLPQPILWPLRRDPSVHC